MKILVHALAVTLAVGSAGAASAAHVPSHRHVGAPAYNALGPQTRHPGPTNGYWGFFYDNGAPTQRITTGGPVGGTGA